MHKSKWPALRTLSRRLGIVLATRDLPSAGEPDRHLMRVLAKYAGQLQWVASIFQPKITQAAALLPVLLDTRGQNMPAQADAGSSYATTATRYCWRACWCSAPSAQACQQRPSNPTLEIPGFVQIWSCRVGFQMQFYKLSFLQCMQRF